MALGEAFHATPQWPGLTFFPEDFRQTAKAILDRGVIFLSRGGLIGLVVAPSLYNREAKVAAEMFFWAPDGEGDALRRAAEEWARERADVLVMNAHEPGDVERIACWYGRKGYVPMGRQFAKVL